LSYINSSRTFHYNKQIIHFSPIYGRKNINCFWIVFPYRRFLTVSCSVCLSLCAITFFLFLSLTLSLFQSTVFHKCYRPQITRGRYLREERGHRFKSPGSFTQWIVKNYWENNARNGEIYGAPIYNRLIRFPITNYSITFKFKIIPSKTIYRKFL